jgi:hypothetical protein
LIALGLPSALNRAMTLPAFVLVGVEAARQA